MFIQCDKKNCEKRSSGRLKRFTPTDLPPHSDEAHSEDGCCHRVKVPARHGPDPAATRCCPLRGHCRLADPSPSSRRDGTSYLTRACITYFYQNVVMALDTPARFRADIYSSFDRSIAARTAAPFAPSYLVAVYCRRHADAVIESAVPPQLVRCITFAPAPIGLVHPALDRRCLHRSIDC